MPSVRVPVKNKMCKTVFQPADADCARACAPEKFQKKSTTKTIRNISELFSGKFKGLKRRLSSQMRASPRRANVLRKLRNFPRTRSTCLDAYPRCFAHQSGCDLSSWRRSANRSVRRCAYRRERDRCCHDGRPHRRGHQGRIPQIQHPHRTTNNDIASLKEVLERRLNHPESGRCLASSSSTGEPRSSTRRVRSCGKRGSKYLSSASSKMNSTSRSVLSAISGPLRHTKKTFCLPTPKRTGSRLPGTENFAGGLPCSVLRSYARRRDDKDPQRYNEAMAGNVLVTLGLIGLVIVGGAFYIGYRNDQAAALGHITSISQIEYRTPAVVYVSTR